LGRFAFVLDAVNRSSSMTDTHTPQVCSFCKGALPSDAPKGFCPRCLLQLFGGQPDAAGEATSDAADSVSPDSGRASALRTIRRFGEYELFGKLPKGAWGIVYLARHTRLNRTVALKLIRSGQLATTADCNASQRGRAAAHLDHPNIVPIYEVGERDGQPFFTMKLIEGGNLAERSSEFRVSSFGSQRRHSDSELGTRNSKLSRLMATLARAVHHAHQRGVLHRDLKADQHSSRR
jgi:serine/threonine-protein kinase